MKRIEFIRSTGRLFMVSVILATAGMLLASGKVSFRNYCTTDSDCAGCGLRKVCRPAEKNKENADEKE